MFNVCSLSYCYCKLQILLMEAQDFLQLHNWREQRTNSVTDMQHCSTEARRVNDATGDQMLNLISGAIKLHAFMSFWEMESVIHYVGHDGGRCSHRMRANTEEEATKTGMNNRPLDVMCTPLLTKVTYSCIFMTWLSLFKHSYHIWFRTFPNAFKWKPWIKQ